MKKEFYINKKYDKLKILEFQSTIVYSKTNNSARQTKRVVKCLCDCGNFHITKLEFLINKKVKSCGCLKKELDNTKFITHGLSKSSEFTTWCGIKQRCLYKKSKAYCYYGAKGITISDSWLKFENFFEDMGKKPSPLHSIERIDNSGNYCKENCKWATVKEQANNKNSNKNITFKGKTQSMINWCKELNLNYSTIRSRFRYGWSIENCFKIK